MGKRELLLIAGFVVAGIVVFQIAAPAPREGEGFSLSRIWNRARAEVSRDAVSAEASSTRSIAIAAEVTDLQLVDFPSGFTITGEDRADIEYDMKVTSRGPDDATALAHAKTAELRPDQIGETMTLASVFHAQTNRVDLKIRVPARLKIRSQTPRRATFAGVAALHLDQAQGDTKVSNISGALTGEHRSGPLSVTGSASVGMMLLNSTATFATIRDGVALEIRSGGSATVADSRGALTINSNTSEIRVSGHAGRIRVSGSGGRVVISDPTEETRVEARDMEVEIAISRAVPISAQTSGETLRLMIAGAPGVDIDAVAANGGKIQAAEFNQPPETSDERQTLRIQIGEGTRAKIALRNRGSDIVIRQAK